MQCRKKSARSARERLLSVSLGHIHNGLGAYEVQSHHFSLEVGMRGWERLTEEQPPNGVFKEEDSPTGGREHDRMTCREKGKGFPSACVNSPVTHRSPFKVPDKAGVSMTVTSWKEIPCGGRKSAQAEAG